METVNAKRGEPQVVVCGAGRIGGHLMQLLNEKQVSFVNARIDSQLGLLSKKSQIPSRLKVLVICISAGHKSKNGPRWQWDQILRGLVTQIQTQQLLIDSVVLVSSSRVYEAYQSGLVTAASEPSANSVAGQALISAEQQLLDCAVNTVILNCSGLYGIKYSRYTPIMLAAEDKPRFGVDAETIAYVLMQLVEDGLANKIMSQRLLLTDGQIYYKKQQLNFKADKAAIEKLAKHYRILLNSKVVL